MCCVDERVGVVCWIGVELLFYFVLGEELVYFKRLIFFEKVGV